MAILSEGRLQFIFGESCLAEKYDDWSFFRNQFQSTCGGAKAVDMVCLSNHVCWLIEIKDYRVHQRTKPQDLADEIAAKVKDTLAGLFAAKTMANELTESAFSKKAINSNSIKVVLHLEQPEKKSKLRPRAIDLATLKQSLKRQLRAIDAHPSIVGRQTLLPNMDWIVKG
jgi:hypothetical protein